MRLFEGVGLTILGVVVGVAGLNQYTQHKGGSRWPLNPPSDSPIVVRGGSMTIRTFDKNNGWPAGSSSFCMNHKFSAIELDGVSDWGMTTPLDPFSVPTPASWTLTIQGRATTGSAGNRTSAPSGNGIKLTGDPLHSCSGATGGSSITLSLLSGNSAFYSNDDPSVNEEAPGKKTAKRFQDVSLSCAGPDSGPGDEDACERASKISLAISGATTDYNCINGECIVEVLK